MEHRVKDNSYGQAALQTKMLEILEEFIRVCRENGLTYFACGGTCIGALRHDGFIPWDDDLDVFMPRPDYEKLWELRDRFETDKYKLCRTTEKKNYHHRVQQLVDLNTTFINKRSKKENIEHGVYIDILPLDGCAPSRVGFLRQKINAILFSVYNVQCLPEFHGGKLFRTAVFILLHLIPGERTKYRVWKHCEEKMTRYKWQEAERVVELAASVDVLRHPYPKEWFKKTKPHKFEDIIIDIPIGAEEYLAQVFGDYMKLPQENKRHPRHNTVLIDLSQSYEVYR